MKLNKFKLRKNYRIRLTIILKNNVMPMDTL